MDMHETYLAVCAMAKHGDLIEYFCKYHRRRINKPVEHYRIDDESCLLHVAAQHNQLQVVQQLVRHGADVNMLNKENESPLIQAAGEGNTDVVKFLVEAGARIDTNDNAAIHDAAARSQVDTIRFLVQAGASLGPTSDSPKFTPLHTAANFDACEGIEQLLDLGAQIEALDQDGNTPLHTAIQSNSPDAACVLVERGANIDRVNKILDITSRPGRLIKTFIDEQMVLRLRTFLIGTLRRGRQGIVSSLPNDVLGLIAFQVICK